MAQHALKQVEQLCSARGIRLTPKRKAILSILNDASGALSAYEITDICRESLNLSLPPMSVYRMLDFLQSAGLVHKLLLANKFVMCSHICCEHRHETPQFLICTSCNHVEEVGISNQLVKELEAGANKVGYQMLSPQFEIQCICPSCQAKQ